MELEVEQYKETNDSSSMKTLEEQLKCQKESYKKKISAKKKTYLSKRNQNELKRCEALQMYKLDEIQESFHVFGDIFITEGFQIKLGGAVTWSVIGFDCFVGEVVEINDIIVNIQQRLRNMPKLSLDQVMERCKIIPCQKHHQLYETFKQFQQKALDNYQVSKIEIQLPPKQEENNYKMAFKMISKLAKTQPLFGYGMGKINTYSGDIDLKHMGFSRGFLDLIGMDPKILEQLILRNKAYQLIPDSSCILEQSLGWLNNRVTEDEYFEVRLKITTVDGYDLWVNQINRKITLPQIEEHTHFFFGISEIDVDTGQIKGLIEYRKRQQENNLNFEEIIKLQLSHLYEDIEYSIHSQSFLEENYYQELKDMFERENNKQTLFKDQKRMCGIRNIND